MSHTQGFSIVAHSEQPIPAQAIRRLYDMVGWWPNRSLDAIARVLNQNPAVGAWAQDELIGFARAITDHQFRAYLEDVIVHPNYRHQGIALQLINHLLERLAQIETISLFCSPELAELYTQAGFRAHPNQVVMHRTRKK